MSVTVEPPPPNVQQAAWEAGSLVYTNSNLSTSNIYGGLKVSVRWGDPGKILDVSPDGSLNIRWESSCAQDDASAFVVVDTRVEPDQVSTTRPSFAQGQWIRFLRGFKFRSGRVLQKRCLGVVLDQAESAEEEQGALIVRAAPYGGQPAFDFSVSVNNVESAVDLLTGGGLPCAPEELVGGFRATDVVFATRGYAEFARGDIGLVFGPGRVPGTLLVRFEACRNTGQPMWCTTPPDILSKEPPLCKGRRVRLLKTVGLGEGKTLSAGSIGTLVSEGANGELDTVRARSSSGADGSSTAPLKDVYFGAPPGIIAAIVDQQIGSNRPEHAARLAELESLAVENENANDALQNVSMLEQTMFGLFGFGCGIGLGFLDNERASILANMNRCQFFKPHRGYALDGTLNDEKLNRFDHHALVADHQRVNPYAAALRRAAQGQRVLDIGTGPFCLLARLCLKAGAEMADAVEANLDSVKSAISSFEDEREKRESSVPEFVRKSAALDVSDVSTYSGDDGHLRLKVRTAGSGELALYHGLSSDTSLALRGGYTLLVHEILGDFAGTENAAAVVADIHQRGLLAPGATCVPRSSSTMLAPTAVLERGHLETLLHRMRHHGKGELEPRERYYARYFNRAALLADPQPLEFLDFCASPEVVQDRVLEFRTARAGDFDGVHMHLLVDLDGIEVIDALQLHSSRNADDICSWNTTYVRLLEKPISLPAGSRIVFRCNANLSGSLAKYSINVAVGEPGDGEREVSSYAWEGG